MAPGKKYVSEEKEEPGTNIGGSGACAFSSPFSFSLEALTTVSFSPDVRGAPEGSFFIQPHSGESHGGSESVVSWRQWHIAWMDL